MTDHGGRYGGEWTREKLDVLQRYLEAYTTALKKQSFQLWYIDAFAGTGDERLQKRRRLRHRPTGAGSARRLASVIPLLSHKPG